MVILDILLLKGKDNKILSILKYLGVTTTMVTFITVYFFIIYMKDIRLGVSMMGNMWLIVHTICPILGIISFLFLDFSCNMKYKYVIIPIAFTICYTIMILIVYMANGRIPYVSDFENDYNVDGWFILLLGVIETIITSILAFIIIFIKNRMERFKYLRR